MGEGTFSEDADVQRISVTFYIASAATHFAELGRLLTTIGLRDETIECGAQ